MNKFILTLVSIFFVSSLITATAYTLYLPDAQTANLTGTPGKIWNVNGSTLTGFSFASQHGQDTQNSTIGGKASWHGLNGTNATMAGKGNMSGPTSPTQNHLVSFLNSSGKYAKDSGLLTSDVSSAISNSHNSSMLGSKLLSEAAIGNDKFIKYNTVTGHLEYGIPAGSGNASGPGAATSGHLLSFVTNTQFSDSGIVGSDVSSAVSLKHNTSMLGTKAINEGAIADNKYIKYDSATGKLIYGTPTGAGNVSGPGAATTDHLTAFTSSTQLKDSTITTSSVSTAVSNSHNSSVLGTKVVNEGAIGDQKYLKYDSATGKLVYGVPVGTGNMSGVGVGTINHIALYSDSTHIKDSGHTLSEYVAATLVTSVGSPGSDTNVPSEKAVSTSLGTKPTASLVTSIGNPGLDTNVVSEKAIETRSNLKVNKSGDTMSGPLAMGAQKITGLGNSTLVQDATTRSQMVAGDQGQLNKSDIVTTIANPGLDTKVPSEKSVRTALGLVTTTTTYKTIGSNAWDNYITTGTNDGNMVNAALIAMGTNCTIIVDGNLNIAPGTPIVLNQTGQGLISMSKWSGRLTLSGTTVGELVEISAKRCGVRNLLLNGNRATSQPGGYGIYVKPGVNDIEIASTDIFYTGGYGMYIHIDGSLSSSFHDMLIYGCQSDGIRVQDSTDAQFRSIEFGANTGYQVTIVPTNGGLIFIGCHLWSTYPNTHELMWLEGSYNIIQGNYFDGTGGVAAINMAATDQYNTITGNYFSGTRYVNSYWIDCYGDRNLIEANVGTPDTNITKGVIIQSGADYNQVSGNQWGGKGITDSGTGTAKTGADV